MAVLSANSIVVCVAVFFSLAGALVLRESADIVGRVMKNRHNDHSRPGVPEMARWSGSSPFKTQNAERMAWGERLAKAATASLVTEKQCGGFMSFGDFTWCARAMAEETPEAKIFTNPPTTDAQKKNPDFNGLWGPVLDAAHPEVLTSLPKGNSLTGISFGIRERDPWSEFLSNRYAVPTRLYDCYYNNPDGEGGPMVPNKGELLTPNASGVCPSWKERKCYGAPFEPKHICVDKVAQTVHDPLSNRDLTFENLHETLKDLKPLSTFLKIDVEGSEWDVLETLLDSPEELAKVRALDMEAHMFKGASGIDHSGHMTDSDAKEKRVRIMERLAENFAVVGSTLEWQHHADHVTIERALAANSSKLLAEPEYYTKNGYSLNQFCISFVSRQLLADI